MNDYMLLLHESTTAPRELRPEDVHAIIERYKTWSADLAAGGRLAAGDKLRDGSGRVLRGSGARLAVTDGPYVEAKEVLGGYYVIRAESYDDAVRLASGCPHLALGGTIEVREIEPV